MSSDVTRATARVVPAPLGVATALVAGAAALTQAALLVAGVGVVVGVMLAVGVEEVLGPASADVDAAMRATLVALIVLAVVGGVGETLRIAGERMLRMRAALRLADAGAPMPPAVERDAIARGPVAVLRGLLVGVAVAAGFAGLVVAGAGLTNAEASMTIGGLAGMALAAASVLGVRALGRARPAWGARVERLRVAWPRLGASELATGVVLARTRARAPRDERLVTGRRVTRVDRILTGMTVAAALVVVAGLLLRQQCRRCEPVAYDPFGESFVDGVATIGIALLAVVAVAWLVRGVVAWLAHAVREATTWSRAGAGPLERSAWRDRALVEPRAVELLGRALGVVAALVAAPWIAAGVSGDLLDVEPDVLLLLRSWQSLGPAVAVLAACALAVGVLGVVATRAWRVRVHAHLDADPFPGVVGPAPASRARRRR